ncbi:MAG TPA: AIR carboxylase family protein [Spirochaetia bacterium]|nr:AIR carboxylase family protein [Spirochaetia bacterium]
MKDVLLIIGSESDREQIAPGIALLEEKKLSHELHVYSAHRNLDGLIAFLAEREKEFRTIIACAGLSAALPGVVAAKTSIPVIGVPLVSGPLVGIDALLSVVQLPKGVPVATMGIGKQGILNAVLLAERIIHVGK